MLNYAKAHLVSIIYGQKKEIKKLREIISERREQTEYWQRGYRDLLEEIKTSKIEAYKEFAEKVKAIIDEPSLIRGRVIDLMIDKIDNLVKELTEGSNETVD